MDKHEDMFTKASDLWDKKYRPLFAEKIMEHERSNGFKGDAEHGVVLANDMLTRLSNHYLSQTQVVNCRQNGRLLIRARMLEIFYSWLDEEVLKRFSQWYHWYCCEARSSKEIQRVPFKVNGFIEEEKREGADKDSSAIEHTRKELKEMLTGNQDLALHSHSDILDAIDNAIDEVFHNPSSITTFFEIDADRLLEMARSNPSSFFHAYATDG